MSGTREGWQEEWGKVPGCVLGAFEEESSKKETQGSGRNTSLVIPTPAGGTGRGRPLCLSGCGAAEAGGPGAGGGGLRPQVLEVVAAAAGGGGICKHIQKELVIAGLQGAWAEPMQKQDLKRSFFMACEARLLLRATWGGPPEPHVTTCVAPLTHAARGCRRVSESYSQSLQTFAELNYILILSLS